LTPQEKLQVFKEWELCGNGVEIAKEYEIHPHTPCIGGGRPWSREGRPVCLRQAFLSGKRAKVDPRIKELEEENRKLKEAPAIQSPVCVQRTGRS